MAAERLNVRHIKDIFRQRFLEKRSQDQIAKSLGIGKTTVREYLQRALSRGITDFSQVENLDEQALEEKLGFTKCAVFGVGPLRKAACALPDFIKVHAEYRRPNVTLALLWQEYREENEGGYSYTQFCEHYNRWNKKLSVTMRQVHKAGEKAFVDYCEGLWLLDPKTNQKVETNLFVGTLGASSYTFAEATLSQTLPEWLMSHCRMYEFFGGVTEITVPDNLKSGVTKACFYEPVLNESYRDCASHYQTVIIPAGIYKPRHKAKVEAAVLVAQRWILARLRNHIFTSLTEMNDAIADLLEILNNRQMRHLKKSRKELFEAIDKPALKSLPPSRYVYAEWKVARLNIDYHAAFDGHFYSCPYQLVHLQVDIRATPTVVEVFHKGKRVSSHQRSYRVGGYTTTPDHMPSHHRKHAEWSPSRVINWAGAIGPAVKLLVEKILETKKHPEQGYKAALGIVRLAKKYGNGRTNEAAKKALEVGAYTYRFVAEVLKNKMDGGERQFDESPMEIKVDPETGREQLTLLGHENVRGSGYYH
jgi:transposase